MKHIRIIMTVALLMITLSGCGTQKPQNNDSQANDSATTETITDKDSNTSNNNSDANDKDNNNNKDNSSTDTKNTSATEKNTKDANTKNNNDSKDSTESKGSTESSSDTSKAKDSTSDNSIREKVIDYINNGQGDKPEAKKLKWRPEFLNKVDIDALYKQYTGDGGKAGDLESFANYMTQNAPILNDWQELFKKDAYDTYGVKIVKIEHLEGDLYQAYIEKDGSQVRYLTVSAKTGYFHG